MRSEGNGDSERFVRTERGETALNVLRDLERRIGQEETATVYDAALGVNSIRLFLRIYGQNREPDWEQRQVRYTPVEIGRLSLFLPRSVEGISAIDKLDEAGLLAYTEDAYVVMPAIRARAFYVYLHALYMLVAERRACGPPPARPSGPSLSPRVVAAGVGPTRARPQAD